MTDGAAAARRRTNIVIGVVIIVGVAIRLLMVRAQGFPSDVGTFMAWGEKLAAVGPARFYEPGYFSDYPPGFLYVLWLLGALFDGDALRFAVKAITIPADIGIVLLLVRLLRRQAGELQAGLAAAIWMLQPAPIFAGPYWGQVDAVGTLPFLAALLAAGARRWAPAGVLAGIATMTKPQFGLVLGVVLVAATVELVRGRDWRPLARSATGALATMAVLALPFGMTPGAFVALVRSASETYPYSSLYAFNGWAIALGFWQDDAAWFAVGGVLLAVGLLVAVVPLWWRRDTAALLAVGAATVMCFYFLPTRAHERYLFPALALLLPLAVTRTRLLAPYLVLALGFFLTVYYAFTRYPQNGLVPPPWLDATVLGHDVYLWLAWLMIGTAIVISGLLVFGEARLEPTLVVPSTAPKMPAAVGPERARWSLPDAFAIGGPAARSDIVLALMIALTVFATRGFRLDWPRDMYFDEVYHARTAFELLAQRDPYEWTHPHLAKEIMALGILAFSDDRVVGTESAPADVTAFAVSNDGVRAYGMADGTITLRDRAGATLKTYQIAERPLALLFDTGRLVAVGADRTSFFSDGGTVTSEATMRAGDFRGAALYGSGRVLVASTTDVSLHTGDGKPAVTKMAAQGLTVKPDGSTAWVLSIDGSVLEINDKLEVVKTYPAVAHERAIAFAQGPGAIVLARADEPVLDSIDINDGHKDTVALANARTGAFASGATEMAVVPRTDFLYAIADGRIVLVDVHGLSPFAAIPSGASRLGVDGTGDTLVALGAGTAERIDTGRLAFSWRLPGVIAGSLLAFMLVLLASRLFRSRVIPVLVGIAVIVDGSMFAQSRIGMNDVYVALFIVAGWYFIVAAHKPKLSSWGDLLIAGALLGLGAASKWAAFYTLAGVLVASLAVTMHAYQQGRAGTGGPLDLLAKRGLNAAFLFLAFAILPVGIYLASYVHWFGGNTAPYGWSLWELTQQMYWYHSGLTSPHPAASPWWSWPLVLKPVYWYFGQSDGGNNAYIYDAGNVVLFWAALPATVWCAVTAIRARSVVLGFVVFALLVQYVAWIPISRVLFFYHFFTALPFYLLALCCALAYLWHSARTGRVAAYLALAAAAFVYFYPFVSALPVPGSQAAMFFILPTWQYDCQFYPSFVCPINMPGDLPLAAIAARIGVGLALAAIAVAAFFVLRSPEQALARARAALGRDRGTGSDDRAR